ncbi:MAG: hypothetical protein FWC97_00300 [Treponema sp.]|nr:hypothetical protein [Treponema sp.]
MNEKTKFIIYFFATVTLIFIIGIFSGCRGAPSPRIEYLVEARIVNAVNAERARWLEEHNRNLAIRIAEGLSEADARVSAADGELQQVIAAAREYRALFLSVIDYLLSYRSCEPSIETDIENNCGGSDCASDIQNFTDGELRAIDSQDRQ